METDDQNLDAAPEEEAQASFPESSESVSPAEVEEGLLDQPLEEQPLEAPPVAEPALDETAEETPPVVPPLPSLESPPERAPNPAVRRFFRWVVGLLIVFGLGAITVLAAVYLPASRRLNQVQDQLERARIETDGLNAQLDQVETDFQAQRETLEARLSSLEAQAGELQDELDMADLHIRIVSALADVRSAQLALQQEDAPRARVHLTNTPTTLVELEGLVGPEQAELVASMRDRLELAVSGLEGDAFAAQSDLDVLANNLVQLENTFFANP